LNYLVRVLVLLFVVSLVEVKAVCAQPKPRKEEICSRALGIDGLHSSDPAERANAARFLTRNAKLAIPAIPCLIDLLGDDSPIVWRDKQPNLLGFFEPTTPGLEAAKALVRIGKLSVEPLLVIVKDGDTISARSRAAWALGEIGDSAALEQLITALEDGHWLLRKTAAEALEKISGQKFGMVSRKWQEWWKKNKGDLGTWSNHL
jgi:HEAT repeat protein